MTDNQGATLNPLNVSTSMSGGALSMTTIGSAGWSSSSSMTVDLDIARLDGAIGGTGLSFTGRGIFNYQFTVSADTTVTIDYNVVGTSTYDGGTNSASNLFRWWAMQGYDIVLGANVLELHYPTFTDPATFSPVVHQGSVVFNILAGTHTLDIRSIQSASGNQPGDRATDGTFQVTIGPVPEPSTLALAAFGFIALAALGWRRRKG